MLKIFVICVCLGMATALSPRAWQGLASSDYGRSRAGGKRTALSPDYGRSRSGSSDDAHAETVKQYNNVHHDGGFESVLETTNQISQSSAGDAYGNMHGQFSWITPEGEHIELKYVADENGYHPEGAILPTPPPIPEAILKALAYIEAHPPKEEVQSKKSSKSNNPKKYRF